MFGNDDTGNTLNSTITPDGATEARADISMGVGTLRVRGESANLMDGHFEFADQMDPQISYSVDSGKGRLDVRQPRMPRSLRMDRNKWSLALSETIPLDLRVDNGAGDVDIDMTGANLKRFDLDHAAGKSQVVIGGSHPLLNDVDIDVAAGNVKFAIPGICATLRKIKIEAAAGNVEMDLRGSYSESVDVSIELAAGKASVLLPADVNILAKAKTMIGRVNVIGLQRAEGGYVRHVPNATRTVVINASIAAGNLNLEVAEA